VTPTKTDDERHIVINCPQCYRVIWAGSKCHHGQPIIDKNKDAPKENARTRSGGLRRRRDDEEPHGAEVDD